jgi:hypothetical protein
VLKAIPNLSGYELLPLLIVLQSEDVLRFDVDPEVLNENVEQLSFKVESTGDLTGLISISWEKVKISFDIESLE